ncbi:hypothetical protein [Chitinophaga tropicalis]|uniref:Uncharacterized protein n=1 Tax=Chitinophaga tropicalis TaxID=2683588 RepID=A0A7K1U5K9_9BACT|nr:hypothetical protein [Chitinophaga tropicalis]MVT09652.1 hypothetical protein [Chitinophaga tropicalis]
MARNIKNPLLQGISGTLGRLLTLTQRPSGKTVLGIKRGKSKKKLSDKQIAIQEQFKLAVIYAKAALEDPILQPFYEKFAGPDQSAYNMAFADAMKPPEIRDVSTVNYLGRVGDTIIIRAIDAFKVVAVKVAIRTAVGDLIEEGNAVLQVNGLDWLYTATVANEELPGSKIKVTATDTPANATIKEIII